MSGPGGAASDACCDTNSCCGMATWWISEPEVNLRMEDEPISYFPGRGVRVSFHLSYRQRVSIGEDSIIFGVGTNWTCNLRQCIYGDPGNTNVAYLHRGGAFWSTYSVGSGQARDGSLLTVVTPNASYKIEHRDGSVDTSAP